jgi:hypothetical protein
VLLLLAAIPFPTEAQERTWVTNDRTILGSPEDLTASLVFVDVDDDADLDIIYANGRHWPQLNEVYLNNGTGQFTVGHALGPEKATTYAVPAGDLDGDGDADVVVGNDRAENWVYLNDGKGRFALAWAVGPEIEPTRSAQLYDLNGDGSLDVLVTNRGTANGFYLNDGTGRFGTKQADAYTFGSGNDEPRSVALADFDDDGVLDIVSANIGEPNGVYLGRGDGSFDAGVAFGASELSYAVTTADVEGDGDEDIIIANVRGRNAVYLNDGSAKTWIERWLGEEGNTSYGVAAADLNGDRYPEIGFANSGAFNRLFLNVVAAPTRD